MKKKIFALFAVPMVLVGLSSCNKTVSEFDATNGETGTLNLKVTFASTGLTKTITDNVSQVMRPTSTWDDVNSLVVLVCNSENTVVARKAFTSSEIAAATTTGIYSVTNVPVGEDYTVYAIANYTTDETSAWTNGYGGLPGGTFTVPAANGTIGSLDIASYTIYDDSTNDYEVPTPAELFSADNAASVYAIYSAAPNYFVGSESSVEVTSTSTATPTVPLKRPANLVRVKVKLSGANVDGSTDLISFDDEDASMVLRRVNTTYSVINGYAFTKEAPEYNVSFAPGPFTELPLSGLPAGYAGTALTADDYTWYKDMLSFPPTNYTGDALASMRSTYQDPHPEKLNLVLYGVVTENGYEDYYGVPCNEGDVVSFSADVDLSTITDYEVIYDGNVIITLNVDLSSAGTYGGEPPVSSTGSMNVTVTLSDWEYEVSTDITI